MTPDQLITFSVVAELRNITQAARTLHLSQPAVSGQLQALQLWFGEPLYYRKGRGIELTPAGLALEPVADRMRKTMEQARQLKRATLTMDRGLLRLGASTTPASYLLPGFVASFRKQYPGVIVHMVTGNSQQVLERLQELDLAFVEGELDANMAVTHRIRDWHTDEVVAVVRHDHPFAALRSTDLETLAGEFLVLREQGSGVRRMVLEAFAKAGYREPEHLELAGVEGVKEGVRAGLGVGFVSSLSLQHEDGSLVGVRIGQGLTRTIRILEPGRRTLAHAVEVFLDQITPPQTSGA